MAESPIRVAFRICSLGALERDQMRPECVDSKSPDLQAEINRLAERLGVSRMPVGLRTNDGLSVYVDDYGTHHFAFYERGSLNFDWAGRRAEQTQPEWAKRFVPELAEFFRSVSKPQDIALLPDIGEPL